MEVIDDSGGSYVASVRISTDTSSFFEGDQVRLRLKNLRNKFDSAILVGSKLQALLQSYDDNNYTINTS